MLKFIPKIAAFINNVQNAFKVLMVLQASLNAGVAEWNKQFPNIPLERNPTENTQKDADA